MRRERRGFTIIAALLALAFALSGCGQQESETGQASAPASDNNTKSSEATSSTPPTTSTESDDSISKTITVDGVTFDGAQKHTPGSPSQSGYTDMDDCESGSDVFSFLTNDSDESADDSNLVRVDSENGKLVVTMKAQTPSGISCLLERPDAHFELIYDNGYKSAANRVVDFSSSDPVLLGVDGVDEISITIPYTQDECSDDIDSIAQRYASNPKEFQLNFFYGNDGDSSAMTGAHNASNDPPSSTMETYRNVIYGFHAQVPDNFKFVQGGAEAFSTVYYGSGVSIMFRRQPNDKIQSVQDAMDDLLHGRASGNNITDKRIDGQNAYLTYEADQEVHYERVIVTDKQVLSVQISYSVGSSDQRAIGEQVVELVAPTLAED
ncbi:hypothetical protein [Bifidobacterium jacchi]|uniref:Uncharacterized protein n=1 Tax=Bifidobacterium jacchi TaxID=2490545 RepID=A0A5N5RJ23_9BIFI|nr:hypothetical protein [Bifidobacterium jacchi]KAB5607302.1 hypothetical protein EHS19_05165 [Bifidobacterium jacchi]